MHASTDVPTPTRVPVNGVELEVYEAGRENRGRLLVLCHGFPELAYSWRHQIPALVAAGYHVIAPNQRGYGGSSRPAAVTDYDIAHLTGDLVGLLDHYAYDDATFVGHDWGAMVVWGLAVLHPQRVDKVVALSVPYMSRGDRPWTEFLEQVLGSDYYMVHLNRQPGVADAVLEDHTEPFLRNMFRTGAQAAAPRPGMAFIELARAAEPLGEPLLSEDELAVYVRAFEDSGFAGGLHWYRNLDRNWHLLADADPVVRHPALMIYGAHDTVVPSADLADHVPGVEVITLDSGHWIQQERPTEVTHAILSWLERLG